MSKRKQGEENDGERELIDVDFEFFDPIAGIDWHGVKHLLAQLLQADAPLFHLNLLTDLILSQPLVGSTVKCDGRESDPYAFLSVLNLNIHADHPSIKSLTEYVLSKANQSPALHAVLDDALASSSNSHVGLILSERLINMPVQVIPPMYKMLADEMKWAVEENEPFNFKYYLIVARTYNLSAEELDNLGQNPDRSKRRRGQVSGGDTPRFFHPEDEQFQQESMYFIHYPFVNAQPREADAFGLDTRGCLMLVPAERLPDLISDMQDCYRPS